MRFSLIYLCVLTAGCSSQSRSSPDDDRIIRLIRDLDAKVERLTEHSISQHSDLDISTLPKDTTSDLVFILGARKPDEQRMLIQRRLDEAAAIDAVDIDSISAVVRQIEAFNVILAGGENVDLALLSEVQTSRDRLVELLRQHIPAMVTARDRQAFEVDDFVAAKSLWVTGSSILGMYPASNDPTEAAAIQKMVSDHDSVGSRIDLVQRQRYNLWACQQIHKAWQDFEETPDDAARTKTCLHFLGPVQPGLLEPVALELYRDFLQTIRSKLTDELYQELAEDLSIATRMTLAELPK